MQPAALVHESYLRRADQTRLECESRAHFYAVAEFDERKSRAIELKFFGGMTTEEIGTVLGISVATVGRELRIGLAWLRRELFARFGMRPGTKIDRWNLIQDIFQSALEQPSAQRRDYLARACGGDENLRSEVESLLANDRDQAETIGSVVAGDLKDLVQTTNYLEIGLRLGPYRLVRELDGGGMGVVFLAVRSDDQYFQIVAIKMIRRGMESPPLVQRFRAGRQILATLSHPNIGAILDGGEAQDGVHLS